MHKYEIMIIVDPKADYQNTIALVEGVFKKANVKKAEKLERTELAYPINHSTQAQYLLFEIQAESSLIAEFTRKSNINKEIWRTLVINLDTERGLGKERKVRPSRKAFNPHENKSRGRRTFTKSENQGSEEKKTYSRAKKETGNNETEKPVQKTTRTRKTEEK